MTIRASVVRVFLSSPGDVLEERQLLRNVLDRVPKDPLLRERVYIETVAYDDPDAPTPMAASESPQQSVNRYKAIPSECDLTVVTLWNRFGTKLPLDQLKPDGSRYESGTEWEYEDALRAKKTVWVYYRRSPAAIDPSDPNAAEKLKQRQAVERFIGRFTNADGSLARGYNFYDSPEHLSVLFEQHLKSFLRDWLDGPRRGQATSFRMGQLSFPNPSPDLDKYYIDFGRELDFGKELVGRTEIFAQLENFAASHSRGYFILTADAGLGKTTFAGAVALRHNAAAFFVNASGGRTSPDQFLNHLCATLIARFGLAHDDLPPHSGDTSAFLETVLAEAVAKSEGPLWLVVDGLDEADEARGRNILLLPQSLPDGTYCLLTQTPGDYPLHILPDTPLGGFELRSDSPLQQADVDQYVKNQLAQPKIKEKLGAQQIDRESIRERLVQASQGNFRFLSYVLADLAYGDLPFEITALPQGLLSYYTTTWMRMEATAETHGGTESKRLYRKVLGLLAVAREPVTLGWLAELSGQNPIDIRDVLTTWRRFLSSERRGKVERWQFPDRSFGDFLADKLVFSEEHASIAAVYRSEATWRKHNGYASRNLTRHLRLADDMDSLASLVDDTAWCESQLLIDLTGAAYQNDLIQACTGAFAEDKVGLEEGSPARWLSREIQWSLAAASLRGYWFNVWPVMLAEFVSARILNEAEALAWALRIQKPFDRGRTLGTLAPVLSPAFRLKAIEGIRAIDDEDVRVHNLLDFAAELEPDERSPLINEALSIARSIAYDSESKVSALAHVVDMNDSQSEECRLILREATEIIDRLEDSVEHAKALLILLPLSTERREFLVTTMLAIRSLEDPTLISEEIDNTFGRISQAEAVELSHVMIEVAGRIAGIDRQIDWLKSALSGLNHAERSQLVSRIHVLIRSLPDPELRANQLLSLSDLVSESERTELLKEAEEAISQMPDGAERSIQLCGLAFRSSGEQATQLWRESVALLTKYSGAIASAVAVVNISTTLPEPTRQAGLAAAEGVVRALPNSIAKARLLIELAQASDEVMSRRLVLDAARIPGGVLAAGVQTPDEIEQLQLLAALGARLPLESREVFAERAELVSNRLSDDYARAYSLATLLPICKAERRPQMVDSVRAAAADMEHADERLELLLTLIPEISGAEREEVIKEAVASARAILPGDFFMTVDVNTKTLIGTVRHIPDLRGRTSQALLRIAVHADADRKKELLDEAYDLIFDHPAEMQAEALAELAPQLSADVTKATIAAVRALLLDLSREIFRSALQERVAQSDSGFHESSSQTGDADKNDDEEPDERGSYRISAPGEWFRLNRDQLAPIISISPASESAVEVQPKQLTAEDLRGMAGAFVSVLFQDDLIRANFMVQASIRAWHAAMGQLLKRLAQLTSSETALLEASAIWPGGAPPPVCVALLPVVGGEEKNRLLHDALSGAEALEAPDRTSVWLDVYPYLRGREREMILERLTESLLSVDPTALAELASKIYSKVPETPRVELRKAIHRVLDSIDERRDLVDRIRLMVPSIEALAGTEVLADIAEAILEIRERWV